MQQERRPSSWTTRFPPTHISMLTARFHLQYNQEPRRFILSSIQIWPKIVIKKLCKLDTSKASGADGISAKVLENWPPDISPVLSNLFEISLTSNTVPTVEKKALVKAVPKKGKQARPLQKQAHISSTKHCGGYVKYHRWPHPETSGQTSPCQWHSVKIPREEKTFFHSRP